MAQAGRRSPLTGAPTHPAPTKLIGKKLMNIQVNDLAPLRGVALDAARASVALLDAIENANEIVNRLMVTPFSMNEETAALHAELITISNTAEYLTQHL